MLIISKIAGLLPPRAVNWLGRLQYRVPVTRQLIQIAADAVRHRPSVIRYGVAAGLRFNPHGGNPGYALGTSGDEEQQALYRYLKPGDVFYDIGANKGFYAVIGARLVGDAGHVYAFEPFPDSAAAVLDNLTINGFRNFTVLECAIADKSVSSHKLITEGDSVVFKLSSSPNVGVATTAETIDVEVQSIDKLIELNRIAPPSVVMIDVEGSEVDVLVGMSNTIREYLPLIICEVHWLMREIVEMLNTLIYPLGYTVTQIDGQALPDEVCRYHMLMLPPGYRFVTEYNS